MLGQAYTSNMFSSPLNLFFGLIVIFSAVQSVFWLFTRPTKEELKKHVLSVVIMLALLIFLTTHEFLASGIYYRLFWLAPLTTLLIFILIAFGSYRLPRAAKILLYGLLFYISLT